MGMRTAVRTLGGLAVTGAVVLAGAGPAGAKGPDHVAIGVPGGVPVELSAVEGADTHLAMDLAEDLGVWEVTGDGLALVREAPTAYLGPALRVEWTMYNAVPANPDVRPARSCRRSTRTRPGGALVHTAAGQRYFASDVTHGGWFRAPTRLAADLDALGIESELVVPAPAADPAAAPPAPSRSVTPSPSGGWTGLAAAAAAAVLAAVVVAATMRRSGRDAPAPVG